MVKHKKTSTSHLRQLKRSKFNPTRNDLKAAMDVYLRNGGKITYLPPDDRLKLGSALYTRGCLLPCVSS